MDPSSYNIGVCVSQAKRRGGSPKSYLLGEGYDIEG